MDMNDRDRVRFFRARERIKRALLEKHGPDHLKLIEEKLNYADERLKSGDDIV
jgi:hypothetical protein